MAHLLMLICMPRSVVTASWLPHQEACVFPWTGKYPQLSSLRCLFTTRTSFWAKVQEIASDAACSPTGWSLVCLVCLAGRVNGAGGRSRSELLSRHAQPASQPASRPSSIPEPGDKQGHGHIERKRARHGLAIKRTTEAECNVILQQHPRQARPKRPAVQWVCSG